MVWSRATVQRAERSGSDGRERRKYIAVTRSTGRGNENSEERMGMERHGIKEEIF